MKYAFTIIIPHKNVPDLLQRCLDSIPKRDDLHIIVVDDNSDSKIVDFDRFPGLNNPQCTVIFTKEGKGAGYARNVALKSSDSKWFLFADADDYFSNDLNAFLNQYKHANADLVFYENITIDCETGKNVEKDLMVKEYAKQSTSLNNFNPLRYMTHAPWTKMVNTELIKKHDIHFQEICAANDVWFATQVGHYANQIIVSDIKIYVRTIRKGSLFYSFKAENLLARIEVGYKVNAFLKKENKLEYYAETWGYFLDLRKISWWLFIRNAIPYLYHTPNKIIWTHIKYQLGIR